MKSVYLFNFAAMRLILNTSYNAWQVVLVSGRGAGYIGLHNFTAWIGWNVRGGKRIFRRKRDSRDMYRNRFSLGITRNGNNCPWISSF